MIKSFRPCVARKQSPLLEAQRLGNKSKKQVSVRELAQALPLTSLIDAFSIIVIYLLIGTQSGGLEIQNPQFSLPVARNSLALEKPVAMLRIENNQIFLNDEPVTLQNLEKKLIKFKNKSNEKNIELMVQADQNMVYAQLDPLIRIGSLAGVEKLKFAVLPTK